MPNLNAKILIATTNKGKFSEITAEFADLPFDFIDLKKAGLDTLNVEEDGNTNWENAFKKARIVGDKSGLLTIAEDTGLFIDYLHGKPGIKSKRYGLTPAERNSRVLNELAGVTAKNRGAYFETAACIYNPADKAFSILFGRADGRIAESPVGAHREGMGYDCIFYYPPLKKTFSQMSLLEKNGVSHRGKVISRLKYFLMKQFAFRQIICAAAVIIKDKKMLMTKRRDLRPEFNNKWEFPGGGIENGESLEECLKREIKEETGYSVEIMEQLPEVLTSVQKKDYQVHLILFVCKIISGKFQTSDSETCGHAWFTLDQAIKTDILPLNKKSIQTRINKTVLKKYIY